MDVQSFLNNFLDESNKTVLFATMAVVLAVLILLIYLIRKRKKKKLEEKTAAAIDKAMAGDEDDLAQDSSDSTDLAQDNIVQDSNTPDYSGSNTLAQDNIILDGRSDSTESRILTQGSNSGEEFGAHHPYDNFGSDYKDYDDDVEAIDNNGNAETIDNNDDAETINNNDDAEALAQNTPAEEYNLYTNYNEGFNPDLNKDVEDGTKNVEDNAKDSENDPMEELMDEENDDIYNSDFVDGFFGTLAKNDSKESSESPKESEESEESEESKESKESPEEPEESKEPPVELILHDQISVEENTPKEEEKEKEASKENKKAAITLVDGSDRVMVSVGEKFESRHKKEFTIDVTNEPEIKIALQDGFVFDGRIHFLVSFSEALAQHVSLKDVREIAEYNGDYSGYEIQLDVTDKGDIETIDCTRTFNYKKIKDAVLIIQLSLE